MTSFTRRRALQLGLGAAAGAAVAPGLLSSRAFAQDVVRLVNVEHDTRPLDNAAYQAVYEAFRAKHPGIEIEFQQLPWEQARPKLLTQAQGNTLPDVGRVVWVSDFAAADMLVPIEDRVDQASLDRFDPLLVEQAYGGGPDGQKHLYGVPWFVGTHSILVNKTMFDKAGLELKDSWTTEEFAEYAKALTIPGQQWGVAMNASGIGDPVQIFLMAAYAYGAKWVNGDPRSNVAEPIVFDSEEAAAGVEWYTSLYLNGYAVPSTPTDTYKERDANFQSGKAAIEWQGPWSLRETRENFERGGWELASMPLPKGPAGAFPTSIGGGMTGLFRGARTSGHEDQAFAWVDFLSSDEGQRIYCKTNGMIPASKAVQADPFWADDPLYRGYIGTMATTKVLAPIWATGFDALLDDIVPPLLQGVLLGQLKARDAVSQIQQQLIQGLQMNSVDVPNS